MIEKAIDLLERTLKLSSDGKKRWPMITQEASFVLNSREILHLGHSLFEIRTGYQPSTAAELKFSTTQRLQVQVFLLTCDLSTDLKATDHANAVFNFMAKRDELHTEVIAKSSC
jgi:hypothetical protein